MPHIHDKIDFTVAIFVVQHAHVLLVHHRALDQLRRAHELLDELETLWRARLERFEDVLNETTGKESE